MNHVTHLTQETRESKYGARCCTMSGEMCSSDPCSGEVSYDEAMTLCANRGMRLCFNDELPRCCGTGCGYDGSSLWVANRGKGSCRL